MEDQIRDSSSKYLLGEDELRRRKRKIELRKKKKLSSSNEQETTASTASKGILKRHSPNVLLPTDRGVFLKKHSPLSSDSEERIMIAPTTKFDAVRKPWSSLKDQTKQAVVTIPRRSRSLTEARPEKAILPFKARVTSALKPKATPSSSNPQPPPSSHPCPETPSLMTTLTTSIRAKANRLSQQTPPPRIEITSTYIEPEDDPTRSILKPTTNPNETLSNALLTRAVTFSIPPGMRRPSLSSVSSSTPDLRSMDANSRQSSLDSEDQQQQETSHKTTATDLIVSELLRTAPGEKTDVYYWIDEREKLMKELDKCLLKLRGVSRIIEEQLLQDKNTPPNKSDPTTKKKDDKSRIKSLEEDMKPKVIPELSLWQTEFVSLPKSYSFPYLCEKRSSLSRGFTSWPILGPYDAESFDPLLPLQDDVSEEDLGEWDISMNRLSIARETSILSEDDFYGTFS